MIIIIWLYENTSQTFLTILVSFVDILESNVFTEWILDNPFFPSNEAENCTVSHNLCENLKNTDGTILEILVSRSLSEVEISGRWWQLVGPYCSAWLYAELHLTAISKSCFNGNKKSSRGRSVLLRLIFCFIPLILGPLKVWVAALVIIS